MTDKVDDDMVEISVVLPVQNEEGSLVELHTRLKEVMRSLDRSFEIIYVENRSTDKTLEVLKSLKDARVIVLRLPLFGSRTTQSIALDAGIKRSKGRLIVTMDSDLQNPPEEIPRLIQELESKNLDVVSGWRRNRKDSFSIKYFSKFGSWLRKFVINPGVHDLGCTLKVYRRECFESLDLAGEMHRYLVAILRWKGYRVGEIEVSHLPRTSGKSAYGTAKIFRGFVDMWQVWFWKKYNDRPLHFFGVAGLVLIILGSLMLFVLAGLRILELISLSTSIWPLISVLLIVTGTQSFIFGIMIDFQIKTYYATSRESVYSIKEEFTV